MNTPNTARIDLIRAKLAALNPSHLLIKDESALHIGHAGASSGAGHFAIEISADCFAGKSLVAQHQMIYQALDELMGGEIHALRIKIK